ncbi:hypothetical protein NU219Hw_g8657t1 [Hortaea werneckii]
MQVRSLLTTLLCISAATAVPVAPESTGDGEGSTATGHDNQHPHLPAKLQEALSKLAHTSLGDAAEALRPVVQGLSGDGVAAANASLHGISRGAMSLANVTHAMVSGASEISPNDAVHASEPFVDFVGKALANASDVSPADLVREAKPFIDMLEDALGNSKPDAHLPEEDLHSLAKAEAGNNTAHNDYSCRSEKHPNPVVLIHGLAANYKDDIGHLEQYLKNESFCTYSTTYGAISDKDDPFIGALLPVAESAPELAAFINDIQQKTGADKVDVVGHSEGAFMSLYVPKFTNTSSIIRKVFSIAPPTHGTDFAGIYKLSYILGNFSNTLVNNALGGLGCKACVDLVDGGPGVERLNNGSIAQPGIEYTVLASQNDEIITPPWKAFVNETGVRNIYVQDFCPEDQVGHVSEPYDLNIQELVANTLSGSKDGPKKCVKGKRF